MKNKRWSVLIPALALALCLALAGCGLEPFREEIKGSGVLRETRLPLAASANGYTLRIDGISTRELRGG
ncbi:MAG: hypothetical protein FWC27_03335, partial [Firmicutes bacterium]|nr:hypothetical protein [Bacillota bacterium]